MPGFTQWKVVMRREQKYSEDAEKPRAKVVQY